MMARLGSTIRKDMIVQSRNRIYFMTLVVALLFAVVFTFLIKPEYLSGATPPALLFIIGGTTVIFTAILIMDEKELGVLSALTVTPLATREYLTSKVGSISILADIEVAIMLGIPFAVAHSRTGLLLPNILLLAAGIVLINAFYSMLGVIISVRFDKFTDFMFPAVIILVLLQIPSVYFAGIINSKVLLLIPSAGPIMLVYGAFNALKPWEWIYGIGYSLGLVLGTAIWMKKAYIKHIVNKLV